MLSRKEATQIISEVVKAVKAYPNIKVGHYPCTYKPLRISKTHTQHIN